ncbi:hypothetical protein LCGC14_1781190 [marine sediment metagenome]|uniref:Uncharacterized protein n=1 Tax=marine sediment metagenome TaxID=412755 RepID=A0A0F9GVD7_9ZZZZ
MVERRLVNHPNKQCECHWCGKSLDKEIKQARAEVLASQREYLDRYQKFTELPEELRPYVEQVNKIVTEIRALALGVQPAAKDLEALLEQAHEAALPHAAVQLLKAITEGGDFAVDSPLAKVKQRVEALLREERLVTLNDAVRILRRREGHFDAWVEPIRLLQAELEQARASEGASK